MKLAPKDLYQTLEFDKILEITESYCYGTLGKDYFRNLIPSTEASQIERWLLEVFEYTQTYENNHNFPMSNYASIGEDLKMLSIEGYVLSVESLRNVAKTLLVCYDIYGFFSKRKSTKTLYPTLYDIIRIADFDKELLSEIQRVIDEEGNIRPNASPELLRIARMQNSKRQELDKKFRQIIVHYQSKGWLKDNKESFRNSRRVLSVPSERKRQVRGIIHDESASGKTVFIEPEGVIDLNNDIFDLERDYQREIYRILRDLSNLLRPYIDQLQQYENIIVRFDTIQAKTQLATQLDATKPKVMLTPHYKIRNVIHPLLALKNKTAGVKTVPFHLHFKKDTRILVLSGPNAGGKSVCMKAIGLVQLMLQSGMLIPANEGAEMGIFEQIFADIGDQQSLEDELSTYSSRLQNARFFMENANDKTLILIDEFGSGTDPKMGGAIAEAILRDLNRKKAFGVITTHYSNLKVFAFENKGLINGSMIFDKDSLSPTYQMKMGKPGSSYAFEIATKSGLPNQVIGYARRKVGKQNHNLDEILVDLQRERQKAVEAHEQVLEHQKRLDQLIKNYESAFRELEFARKKLKLQIKEQELVETEKTNKELQKVLRELKTSSNKEKAAQKAKTLLEQSQIERKKITDDVNAVKEGIYEVYEQADDGVIEVGSYVKLRSGGGMGIVKEIKRKEAKVEMGNLNLMVKLRDLQLIKNPILSQQTAIVKTDTLSKKAHFEPKIDIRGMRYEDALERIQEFMDNALMASANEVRIIHGKGSGALRKVVTKKLREYKNIVRSYHPEPHQGGNGMTIVELG
ncbi:endonuclease MutS2 [Aureispira anguillae]|uniref:Endonuclease MutS2 n=1 Tax=Aureispira anguillae TaxID=2864201 RepID=A0A915YH16_9BACT|nr:endonuclease MutS2 [Aureispira anguillae]BDS12874.1 endonuclease MutS2 [Aureispira anguillae]